MRATTQRERTRLERENRKIAFLIIFLAVFPSSSSLCFAIQKTLKDALALSYSFFFPFFSRSTFVMMKRKQLSVGKAVSVRASRKRTLEQTSEAEEKNFRQERSGTKLRKVCFRCKNVIVSGALLLTNGILR